jgi:hypothetical protein
MASRTDFYYHLTSRPPSIGTHPTEEFVEIAISTDVRKDIDGVLSWGVLRYSHPLTYAELQSYEMTPYDEAARHLYDAMRMSDDSEFVAILVGLRGDTE